VTSNKKTTSMCVYYLIKCVDLDDDMSPCGKSKYECGNETSWEYFVKKCPNHDTKNLCKHNDNKKRSCGKSQCPRMITSPDFDFADL
jgi:hypothetical protein